MADDVNKIFDGESCISRRIIYNKYFLNKSLSKWIYGRC